MLDHQNRDDLRLVGTRMEQVRFALIEHRYWKPSEYSCAMSIQTLGEQL